jgi:hypothetical protein
MEPDPVDPSTLFARGDEVDHQGTLVEQLQQGSRAAMGDDRSISTGKGCRDEAPRLADVCMAQGKRSPEQSVQAPRFDRAGDFAVGCAEKSQLPARKDPVLPCCHRRHSPLSISVNF